MIKGVLLSLTPVQSFLLTRQRTQSHRVLDLNSWEGNSDQTAIPLVRECRRRYGRWYSSIIVASMPAMGADCLACFSSPQRSLADYLTIYLILDCALALPIIFFGKRAFPSNFSLITSSLSTLTTVSTEFSKYQRLWYSHRYPLSFLFLNIFSKQDALAMP